MTTKITLLALFLTLVSCGKSGSSNLHKITQEALPQYVNEKAAPDHNLTIDKSITNDSYPLQLALYNDGQFIYYNPKLGVGKGTWRNSDGTLKLKAKRPLFDMNIEVEANDTEGKSLSISFTDRFGAQSLKMSNINID